LSKRRLEIYPVKGKNSMQFWPRMTSPLRVSWNFIMIEISRIVPSLKLKNLILRHLVGMKIGKNVSVGVMAMFDLFRPEYISIGDDTILGYNCTILCHEFLPSEYRLGRVDIGCRVLIGANATVLPGVKIGDGALVGAGALVNDDIPPYTMVGGVPARIIKELEAEDVEAY